MPSRGESPGAANQILYNLAHRGVEYDLLPWCREHHIPVMAYSPADEGRLSRNPVLMEIAQKHEATPVQIALAWILRRPGMIAIPKAGSVMHVQENYRSLSIKLTAEDVDLLDEAFPPPGQEGASGFLVSHGAGRPAGETGRTDFSRIIRRASNPCVNWGGRAPANGF